MPTFAELKNGADTPSLVRKALEGVVFLRRKTSAKTIPDKLLGVDKQPIDLKALGFFPVGVMTTDGVEFSRDVDKAEVEGWGYSAPVRTDIVKAPRSVKLTALESDRRDLAEVIYGMDLSTVVPGTNGEVVFDEPDVPAGAEYEAVVITRDGSAASPYYRGAGLPRIKLASLPTEVWSAADPRQSELEFDVLPDDDLGTPMRHYIGGAAFDATKQGFVAPTP